MSLSDLDKIDREEEPDYGSIPADRQFFPSVGPEPSDDEIMDMFPDDGTGMPVDVEHMRDQLRAARKPATFPTTKRCPKAGCAVPLAVCQKVCKGNYNWSTGNCAVETGGI